MVRKDLLMQFQADTLGVPVIRPRISETTALGAAYAAGLAIGFWADREEPRGNWAEGRVWQPQMDPGSRDKGCKDWKMAVERSLNWVS